MAAMRALLAALTLAILIGPAAAQVAVPQGIGFAQRGDGTWLCRHEDPVQALSCAQEHCKEEAPSDICLSVAWCYPARWSGEMRISGKDRARTAVLCGMADETTLKTMLSTLCAATADAESCALLLTVDPDGNERKIEGVTFAGGAAGKPGSAKPPATPEEAAPPPAPDKGDDTTDDAPEGEGG
jgi:hypothetical protein